MSSPPDNSTAASPGSNSPPSPPAAAPPPSDSSPPPPSSSSPDAPSPNTASPPPSNASPPPSNSSSSPPPPPHQSNSSAPPSPFSNTSPPPPSHSNQPPPPHRSSRSPPPPLASSSSSSSESSLNSEQIKIIVGVSVGVGLLIIVMLICGATLCKKKKKKHKHMQYYGGYPEGNDQYYNSSMQQNWHNGPPVGPDHIMKINSSSPGQMGSSPGGGWHAPPTPPQMMMMSGEMSGNFSGPHRPPLPPPSPNIALGFNKSTFTYDELAAATGGFDQANLLGQGGFGYVHKGVLPNGKEIAVKSLKSGSGQGEREFQAEVEIISRVHHRHLVSLVGYCIAGGQRMLVYEFVSNKTLEYHLHGKGLPVMDFPTRLRIALGSAKGLAYLHEDCHPRIIHRDIKAANILLDFNFEAMVADFGLAKLSSDNYTHVSTRVMGTFGYLAPEYASSGKLTEKSDVFSFGVMLLELITGKKPVDPTNAMEDSLVDWARPLLNQSLEDGNYNELADFRLENNYNPEEMQRMVACAAASIRHSARKRPRMSQIVRALEGDVSLDALNEGTKPGQSSMFSSSNGSSDYDTSSYNADMKKFRQVALSSQEFGSSELGTSSNDSRDMSLTGIRKNNL
ncbi:proline-rich receptor-like protein kinase PERK4 [Ricinus communis]|uniref:non-specific serine/threonine protein kinase n=1 Tax=Ricinus communis TaxID=3988 RepID=B9S6F8_RICCO|nr:proline-rich receptor-like protein kinase PERK4 [Ricinus communis]XP_015576277.1 proline-rich receptor-like protein kinase PERK4 [Ricinus communis]EEF40848.1 somatic embryogenesis receptor kinase, putative [Ricinus communis]|eukprot:XP_002521577.1 proline-rich receptor-like protein kinase PERK4 [Ricinus communis]